MADSVPVTTDTTDIPESFLTRFPGAIEKDPRERYEGIIVQPEKLVEVATAIRDELNPHRYVRGTLGMALSGPNTGGSQFFVTHAAQPHLEGGYTVFGQLRTGGDVLDRIVQGDRIVRITIH